ncbi:50S ribosomal protein L29 [Candidatus Daviesbacteria bacterium]|nr:50S ribosomal protein L29 [Candidatus Daviesbacteria bacterium]
MATKNKTNLTGESVQQLHVQLNQNRIQLAALKLDLSMHKLKDVRQVRKMRRQIARILTVIAQKRLEDQYV